MTGMPIIRTLLAIVALLLLVIAWQASPAPGLAPAQFLSAEMAPAAMLESRPLPARPPVGTRWQALDSRVLAGWQHPYWLRWRVVLPEAHGSYLLRLSLRAASQSYWNGQPLRANGVVGRHASEESPGDIDSIRVLPGPVHAGINELVVLASSHHQWPKPYRSDAMVNILRTEDYAAGVPWRWLVAALAMGALAAACIYLLIAQHGHARSNGVPVLISLAAVGLTLPVVEAWRPLVGYTYGWHGPRLMLLLALHLASALLLPLYLARRFHVTIPGVQRLAYVASLAVAAVLLPSFDSRGAAVLLLSLLAGTALLMRASEEFDERWPIMALLLTGTLLMLVTGAGFLDGPYFLLLSVLMGYLLVRHAAGVRAMELQTAWLRDERSRLSLQLLQRGIHPHWLMNTLTCLQELIEQAPARASNLVIALAEQFDQLHNNSQHARISLQQELELCRNHLHIVSTALGRPVHLEVIGGDHELQLPPGILHAQIENTLTHAGALACVDRQFRLTVGTIEGRHFLELRSALGTAARNGQGTGTQFIEASLAAAFRDGWRFTQGEKDGSWRSRIELTCAS